MSKFDRKIKRLREKLKKKNKKLTLRDANKVGREEGRILLSFCLEHGPYTEDNLCACYDDNGRMDGMTYLDQPLPTSNFVEGCACPIHGSYTRDSLCACYDESGNLREDWNKDLDKKTS